MSGSEEGLWTGNSPVGRQRPRPIRPFVALIHGAAHLGMEAETLHADTALLGVLSIEAGDRLRAQHFLARPGSERDAIGAGGRLQGRDTTENVEDPVDFRSVERESQGGLGWTCRQSSASVAS